jgi:transcriptional regulator with XRE-family HTH domain
LEKETLTQLGLYLSRKPLSQAKLARRTGISKDRMSKLHVDIKSRPTADEIYLIALALEVPYTEIIDFLCKDLKLRPKEEWDATSGSNKK